ncbi:acetyl-CoA acetyltransferase [candidate division TA06 bacterium DG_24]|uniref:Acetyl-CoA acetyltransferase n=3 Tax=Bacteria division TA06 TaxID=1156500 RepID=A0A0S8JPF9_UNCT6|nr:MAG: acetyl-CoA acetyltransferase [candidate division TA06 bacterium DG_24]KPK71522.1 MAG: acetyl-CoA acetyltransferase [candidate division TA06 bacterium SM23_40]KPL11639.1 MAG: acetyl-CoA acetyltransferase [candidate division TA06 bacterium SM1_40]
MSVDRREVVLVSGVRTAVGEFLGTLAPLTAPQLGAKVIEETVRRAGIEAGEVDEVIMGNVVSGGIGQAPARQAAIAGGIPAEIAVMTINKVCGSGLKAVMLGAQAIALGDAEIVVAGGLESMSQVPYYLPKARTGLRMGNAELVDGVIHDGLWCAFEDKHMGMSAEFTAERSKITREEQDEYAYNSHKKALAAIAGGKFKQEIVPVEVPQRKGDPIIFDTDERPREDISIEKLAKLRPAFKKDGTVTAGNAPGLNDGAAAVVVMSREEADRRKIAPMATITGYAVAGTEPKMLFYAPIYAVRKLMEKTGASIGDYDLIELNEAFSAQALADGKELGWDWDRVNIHGGAVALGHPIGASGARVLVTLLYALKDRKKKKGLAVLCLGGGHAVAMSVEMV